MARPKKARKQKLRKRNAPVSFLSSVMRLRVIPLTIVFCGMLFCAKLIDFIHGTERLSAMLIAGPAIAEEKENKEEEAKAEPEKTKKDEKEGKKENKEAKTEGETEIIEGDDATGAPKPKMEVGDTHAKKDEDASAEETKEKEDEEEESGAADGEKKIDEKFLKSDEAKRQFTMIELDILQNLAKRREQLEKWEDEVRMKDHLLEATEVRLNKKIEEMKTMEANIRKILEEYQKFEDAKIRSLVKIYENMKPKDSARIFDEMDMPILLMVIDRMSERKAAPVLASMNPLKAKEVTVQLAAQRKLIASSQETLGKMR